MRPLVLVSLLVLVAPAALACSLRGNDPFDVDPSLRATDSVPPAKPIVERVTVERMDSAGPACAIGSCDGIGTVSVVLATPPEAVGYRVRIAPGAADSGLGLQTGSAVKPVAGTQSLLFTFDGDGVSDVSTALELVAVDAAGNESEAVIVDVADPQAGGCTSAPVTLWALLAFALARRRRS